MRVAIFGAGGIGGYHGGRLAEIGEELVIIARGKHLKAIQQQGLKIDSTKGDFIVYPKLATDNPSEAGEVDTIIVGVKAWQVPEAAKAMRPMVGSETAVVSLQNGVDVPHQLAAVLGAEHIVIGLSLVRCFIVGPGHLRNTQAVDPNLQLGEMDRRPSERVERLRRISEQSGLTVTIPKDIHTAMWEKFLLFSVASGLGAITRMNTGTWRTLPETRQMAETAVREIVILAQATGISLPEDSVKSTMHLIDSMKEEHSTSMAKDILDGRPSELQAAIGEVVRLGRQFGVDTQVNTLIYTSLLPQEMNARG